MKTSFQQKLSNKRPLFIPFIVAGDPHPDVTIEIAYQLQKAGADVIELGVPYSDPLADGPVIQKASSRALAQGMSLKKAIELVPQMRKKGVKIPVLIFTYFNPVLQLGENHFFTLMRENSVDGLLIPDLPYEESEHIRARCQEEGIAFISLVAPTSKERIKMIATSSHDGFLYCVSSLGVTGVRNEFDHKLVEFLAEVKKHASIPIALGFGLSSYEQFKRYEELCDGFIIGSAIVRKIEALAADLRNEQTRDRALQQFLQEIEQMVHASAQ